MRVPSKVIWVAACSALALCVTGAARALEPGETDPRKVMDVADDPPNWDRTVSQIKMTIKDGSGVRERIISVRTKRFSEARKSRIVIEAPADLRGTGFLNVDYKGKAERDEQWLYLPALHKVSRIPDSGKQDAFVGSDFSYADMSRQDPDDFELKMLEASTMVGDEECWHIEATPRNKNIQENIGYTKLETWVSKSKQIAIQLKMWLVEQGKFKYLKASDFRQVDGAWRPNRLQMRTVKGATAVSETVLQVLVMKNKAQEVTDADFTRERLEGGV